MLTPQGVRHQPRSALCIRNVVAETTLTRWHASLSGPYYCITSCCEIRRKLINLSLVRGNRPGKPVQLQEYEIKYLCTKAREIFINQPILLELEAPIKICGLSLGHIYLIAT